ncbi:MAG: exo-alpha-sialidase [Acidobacteriota bacterium]|nr:exo-alpha-sialidase [Acidobacteriota bacterium]
MPETNHVTPKSGDQLLLVGTMKGAFVLKSDGNRKDWQVGGPYFPGRAIYAMNYDGRDGRNKLWAAVNSSYWGSYLSTSNDFGKTWTEPETYGVKFPDDAETSLKQIWQIVPGNSQEPKTLYCGVEPAALFRSDDAGETWLLVKGLHDHPHRPQWQPGGGGLCLHTILPDPANKERMHIAISTGGVYRTDDGGKSWEARNVGVRAQFLPEDQRYPEFGQCVHKIVSHPSNPQRLFLQNHWGLYRSDDGGNSWTDIANGVPSDFGFALEIDHNDANTAYIIPLESDEFRCTPEAKLRVYKTSNAGDSWTPLTNGLPQENAFETVLRDGMSGDTQQPMGIYFGTRNGKLFGSNDSGNSWYAIEEGLPQVCCVKTATVA